MNSAKVSQLMGVHPLDAISAVDGQILEPNNKYMFGYDITSVRLPPSDTLEVGDWIEFIPPIGQSVSVIIQIIDNSRLFSVINNKAFDKNTSLIVRGGALNYYNYDVDAVHRYRFNGRDWQPEQVWTQSQSAMAETSGVKVITESQIFTVPIGVQQITVDIVAPGGGAGGGATAQVQGYSNIVSGGSGAGGGAAVLGARINVTSGQRINIIIGSAGIGGYTYLHRDAQNTNGSDGTSGGNTIFGDWIEVEGGKNGKGGTYLLNATSTSSISSIMGGLGGRVLKNTTDGREIDGGKGGNSGVAKLNNSTNGEHGESILDKIGGIVHEIGTNSDSSGGGAGGASALGDGGNIHVSGSNFGGGGGSSSGYVYTRSGSSPHRAGNGGRSMVKIAWSI
ncbi:hypothetical protein EAG18_16110 [Pseudoalteromonas sp. J010]|uniref:glycine-rich domain-containing protein n=1 Tax=Pseudoalteromonas sp. J010 TaxID=998465 RepID=UPI000F648854|nr:hypothetical protein [Pseudoalteromonas sp. J010]RRS07622.1 hypothetical protein EAG18_16110 [Pseudoalteromonas sp. J010]